VIADRLADTVVENYLWWGCCSHWTL